MDENIFAEPDGQLIRGKSETAISGGVPEPARIKTFQWWSEGGSCCTRLPLRRSSKEFKSSTDHGFDRSWKNVAMTVSENKWENVNHIIKGGTERVIGGNVGSDRRCHDSTWYIRHKRENDRYTRR